MKKTKPTPKTENKPTLVAFLLDRTGSMSVCEEETIRGFNHYLKELCAKDDGSMRFTLTQFDSVSIDIIHAAVPLKAVKFLNDETYQPRAFTPLYDAIGKTIRETEAKATGQYKVLFVTLTDGAENASREWTSATIKALIKEKEDQSHWTFAYIGVGPNGWAASHAIAQGTIGVSNILHSTHAQTKNAYARFAGATAAYAYSTGNVKCSAQNLWGPTPTTEDDPKPKSPSSH